jgi:hypothetical protein
LSDTDVEAQRQEYLLIAGQILCELIPGFKFLNVQSETPIPSTTNPDQPLSHVHPAVDPNDPLAKIKVPCYGDQLTRVRVAGAKDLRAGCHTAKDRTDHVYPVKCADWHCKRSFLKVV